MHAIFPKKYFTEVSSVCESTKISKNLVLAIIKTESSFDKDKVSSKGAIGLMQIMPSTATYVCDMYFAGESFDLKNQRENILIGVTYLNYLLEKFADKKTALCAYNAGEGRVLDWLKNINYSLDGKRIDKIPYKETSSYVKKVILYEKVYNLLY